MPSPEKFIETLSDFNVDDCTVCEICQGYEGIVSKTNKKIKSAFFKQALDVMKEKMPHEKMQAILEANGCCKSGSRLKASKEFARVHKDEPISKRLELISERPYMNMGSGFTDDDGTIVVKGVTYYPQDRYECACPTISKVKRDYDMPREYCYCCGGHFKFHYEIMLGVKLELLEIISSPHDTNGEKPCVFRFGIVDE